MDPIESCPDLESARMFYLALNVKESNELLDAKINAAASKCRNTDLLLSKLDGIDARVSTAVMKASQIEVRAREGLEKDQ